ncbi:MAG TPA: hypothetical protein VK425_04245 [Acidimicrobiales bacterium]|nr:hypothetical protein [Acidimicrobiales bacterium]
MASSSLAAPVAYLQEPASGNQFEAPSDWELPQVPSGTNVACLTAATSTSQSPVPGCAGAPDAPGQGVLRLTAASTYEEGGVASTLSLPTASGLDITFDTYQYGGGTGTAADGLMFFLAAANPAAPQPPPSLGEPGGYLAYSGNSGPGLTDGYLGIGLDVYGNYTNSVFDGSGCSDPSWAGMNQAVPNQVTVRGPGNGTGGYCLLSSTAAEGGLSGGSLSGGSSGARATSQVPVEVAINPSASELSTASGLVVPGYSYVVAVTPLGRATQLVSGTLPYDSYLPPADSSWLGAATGIPRQLVFGFAASTGEYDETHEVSNIDVAPLMGTAPELGLSLSDSEAGDLVKGSSNSYSATSWLGASGASEANAPELVAAFPSGVTPTSAVGADWSCTALNSNVSCTYTGALPIAPGTSLGTVTISAGTAANANGPQEVTASLWENGALVAQVPDVGMPAASAQAAPILGLTFSDDAAGQLAQGEAVTYTASPEISSQGGADGAAISFAATFPVGETLNSASGSNWSCTTAVPTVNCSWGGGTVPSGTPLPAISIAATVGATQNGAAEASASLSSPAASPASTTATDEAVVVSTPTLAIAVSDSSSGDLVPSSNVTYTVSTSVSSSGWAEALAPVVTDNFPTVFSNVTEDSASTDWSCSQATGPSVISETCLYTGPLPLSAGAALQSLRFDNTVSSSGLATGHIADDSASIASADAALAVANDYARIGQGPAPNLSLIASGPASASSNYTLTMTASVASSGGTTSYPLTLEASLPSGEAFASAPQPTGWNCHLSSTALLNCTSAASGVAPGTTLPVVEATVEPASTGLHTAQVTLADTMDGALTVSTSSTTDSLPPVLALAVSPMAASASAGGSYSLSLNVSISSAGGEAFNNLDLTLNLSAGESFTAAPSAAGWECTVPGTDNTQLSCTYAVNPSSPIAPGTALPALWPVVQTANNARGTLTAGALLQDAADGASAVSQSPAVTVTGTTALTLSTNGTPAGASQGSSYQVDFVPGIGSGGGPAYNEPSLSVVLPSGESFPPAAPVPPGWTCSVSGANDNNLACTASTAVPIAPGTALSGVQATVIVGSSAAGSLTTTATLSDVGDAAASATAYAFVDATPTPGLALSLSGVPVEASANSAYSISLSASLSSAGPAYHDPVMTVDLPGGETFASPAPSPAGWGCALSLDNTVLACTSTASGTIGAGISLGTVAATVDIAPSARGTLQTTASLADAQDAAAPADATPRSVQVTATPVLTLSTSGTPSAATTANAYPLVLLGSLASTGGPAYNDPQLSAVLPTGETFVAPLPSEPGWSCNLYSGSTDLECTSTLALPVSPQALGDISTTVLIGSGAIGSLVGAVSLSDTADGAATVTQSPSVDVTPTPVMVLSATAPSAASAGTSYTLSVISSVGSPGGPAYNDPSVTVSLPGGETFSPPLTPPSGWACSLSNGDRLFSCSTTSYTPISAGSSLGPLGLTVNIASGVSGALQANLTLSDSADGATTATASSTVDVTGPPVLALSATGAPTSAPAGSSYTLLFSPSLRSVGGPAYHPLALTALLPSGETFSSPAPSATGWSCAYALSATQLNCVSTLPLPVSATVALSGISAPVQISPSASGTLTTTVTLSDTADAATPVTLIPGTGVVNSNTPGAGPEPPPILIGPPSTTSAGPTTSTTTSTTSSTTSSSTTTSSTTTSSTTSSSTTSSATSSTTTSSTTTTGPAGHPSVGPGPLQNPLLPPILKIVASAPAAAKAGSSFKLVLKLSLDKRGGAAYHGPAFSVDLPAHLRFRGPAPKAAGWSCRLSLAGAVLACAWTGKTPIKPGRSLGQVTARVLAAADASGKATAVASAADTADAARLVHATATVTVSAVHPLAKAAKAKGYRLVAVDGGVFSFGGAKFEGSCQEKSHPCGNPKHLSIVAMALPPSLTGYWLVAANGAVFKFGSAHGYGSCTRRKPGCGKAKLTIAGAAGAHDGRGYWLVSTNGAIFSFGDARNYGSCTALKRPCGKLTGKVVGIAATSDGKGYWLAESTGRVFAFGDAARLSNCRTSAKSCRGLLAHVTSISATASGRGYWLVNQAGRVFAFGDAKFMGDLFSAKREVFGATKDKGLRGSIVVGLSAQSNGDGYWLACSNGIVLAFQGGKLVSSARVNHLAHAVTGIGAS